MEMERGASWSVSLADPGGDLRIYEPDLAALQSAAPLLADFYNEPFNRSMTTGTCEMTPADAIDHFRSIWAEGGLAFLLEYGSVLLGDADFRHFRDGIAEYAIMVGSRASQGAGLGTRFSVMAHALLFGRLGANRIYSIVIPENAGCLRMLAKIGYEPDDSPLARSFIEAESDRTLSIGRERFEEKHADLISRLVFTRQAER